MMSTFENEAIHYCFLNVRLTLGLTKKIVRKKNLWLLRDLDMSSGMVRASNPVVEAQLCGFSLSARSRDKYSLTWHSMA